MSSRARSAFSIFGRSKVLNRRSSICRCLSGADASAGFSSNDFRSGGGGAPPRGFRGLPRFAIAKSSVAENRPWDIRSGKPVDFVGNPRLRQPALNIYLPNINRLGFTGRIVVDTIKYCQFKWLKLMSEITEQAEDSFDAGLDPVREALKAVKESGILSVQDIIDAANKAGCEVKIKRSALDQYIAGKNASSSARSELGRFVFRSPLGRALRSPDVQNATLFDRFFHEFLSAPSVMPEGLDDATGSYFVYHGSYLLEQYAAIHLMEIEAIDDRLLVLTDYIRDDKTGDERVRKAYGCVTFFLGKPHILISGHDNRIGLNLIVGDQLICKDGSLQEMSGAMLGMTDRLKHFYRKTIIQRCPAHSAKTPVDETVREGLIEQTGIFRIAKDGTAKDKVDKNRRVEGISHLHQRAFGKLANLVLNEVFDDPFF
jgi:hypothetical protein